MDSPDQEQHPDPSRWWRNRRRQAYVALACLVGMGAGTMAGTVPEHAIPLAQTLAWVFASIVAVYSGGASIVDGIAKMRGGR